MEPTKNIKKVCKDCGDDFELNVKEQVLIAKGTISPIVRCRKCRRLKGIETQLSIMKRMLFKALPRVERHNKNEQKLPKKQGEGNPSQKPA